MIITISATLTEEQIAILAQVKGYSPKIQNLGEKWVVESDNPQSPAEFIRSVYESMIINDATNVFLGAVRSQMAEQVRVQEEAIRWSIQSSITSSIWN